MFVDEKMFIIYISRLNSRSLLKYQIIVLIMTMQVHCNLFKKFVCGSQDHYLMLL